jgi:tetratricopeptide (TPR) repeat protein
MTGSPSMSFAHATLRWQRWLLAAMLLGSAVLILPAAVEPFMLPKATLVVALALCLAGLGAARAVESRRLQVPWSPAVWAVAAFAVALVVTTATSSERWASLVGFYGRYTGLAPYLAYLVVFAVVLRVADVVLVRLLTRTALVALGLTVAYGFLQALGAEPFGFQDKGLGTTFSFFGNTNFGAAWAGAVSALALVSALSRTEPTGWRLYAALLLPLTLIYALSTGTFQGPVVALIALGFAGLAVAAAPDSRFRRAAAERRGVALAVGGAAVLALAVVVGAALPTLRAQLDQSLVERPEFWAAAVDIFADHPVVGTGLDTYAHYFLAYRPASHALRNGVATTDAPHSVPLGMFANGGLLLGLTYLAVVLLVGVALVRGVLRAEGRNRLALAGWGGVWLGYQAQSLVSFDIPPLAFLHWLSAGIIVALAAPPRWREVALPGSPPVRPVNRRGKEYGAPLVPASTRVLQGAVAVIAVVGLWFTAYPLRADLRAASAAPLASSGQFAEAIDRFESATGLNPAEATYPFLAARGYEAAGQPAAALAAATEAARRDPGTVQYALFAARQAAALGQFEVALGWYDEALERDPRDPPVLREVARFRFDAGQLADAEELARRALAFNDDDLGSLVLLAEVLLGQGEMQEARAAVDKALLIQPSNEAAALLLEQIVRMETGAT